MRAPSYRAFVTWPTTRQRISAVLILGLGPYLFLGCEGFADQGQPVLTSFGRSYGVQLTEVDTGDFHGLSDLTHTVSVERGRPKLTYWAIPEQQRALLELDISNPNHPVVAGKPRPIVGLDEAYDTESVTWLGDGRFAIGTETQQGKRSTDTIFIVAGAHAKEPQRGPLHVVDSITMPYSLWPDVVPKRNEGLEGVCAAGNVLLASSETVGRSSNGTRYAPLGRYDLIERRWLPYTMALTLPTGRLSAVQCRISQDNPGHIEVLAIERHFGVGRILHAWLPLEPNVDNCQEPQMIFPELLADLAPMMAPLINFEGIDWLPNGDLLLVTDNYMGFVRGPTFILRLPKH